MEIGHMGILRDTRSMGGSRADFKEARQARRVIGTTQGTFIGLPGYNSQVLHQEEYSARG
jgi:hypothetical protein